MSRSTFITIENAMHRVDGKPFYPVAIKVSDDEGIVSTQVLLDEYWADLIEKELQKLVRKIRRLHRAEESHKDE